MMSIDFEKLLQCARAGDKSALGKLLFRHYDELVAVVERKFLRGSNLPFDAEDIVQQTLSDASQKIAEVEAEDELGFFGWLNSIANSRFVDGVRAHNSKKRGGGKLRRESDWVAGNNDSFVKTFDRIADTTQTPSKIISLDEKVRTLKKYLGLLPSHYRDAIVYKDIQELSRSESAELMNKTEDEFRGILLRARAQLKKLLGDESQYITHK